MTKTDLFGLAKKARFQNDLQNFKTELHLYQLKEAAEKSGEYDTTKLHADEVSLTYDDVTYDDKTIVTPIPSLEKTEDYDGKLEVINGKLVFKGEDEREKEWAREVGIDVLGDGNVGVTIISISEEVVLPGTDVKYMVRFSSFTGITNIDLENNLEIIYANGSTLASQPTFNLDNFTSSDNNRTRTIDVTINTDSLEMGVYKLKVKAGAATNEEGLTNEEDIVSVSSFIITNNIS